MREAAHGSPIPVLELCGVATSQVGPVDLRVDAGRCVTLAGPSGAGKSLLLRAVADLDPHHGQVWLDGREAAAHAPTAWRRRVQLVPPEPVWWRQKVGEHFPMCPLAEAQRLGFGAEIWEREVARLSSGERQRLALLRSLVLAPRVLLLDEPTANLDPATCQAVEALVRDHLHERGACALWVGHDAAQLRRVGDSGIRLEAGRLVRCAA